MFKSRILVVTVWTILLSTNVTLAEFNIDTSSSFYNDLINGVVDTYIRYVQPERTCSSPGIMCKNCNKTVFCIDMGNGQFEEYSPQECDDGDTCLETECVAKFNPQCSNIANIPFPCTTVGVFPNQFDCRRYHMCVPSLNKTGSAIIMEFIAECSAGYKYNPKTTYCDKSLTNNKCYDDINIFPVPFCLTAGIIGALPENPSIFYICEDHPEENTIYPFLYLCPNGKIFDLLQLRCVDVL